MNGSYMGNRSVDSLHSSPGSLRGESWSRDLNPGSRLHSAHLARMPQVGLVGGRSLRSLLVATECHRGALHAWSGPGLFAAAVKRWKQQANPDSGRYGTRPCVKESYSSSQALPKTEESVSQLVPRADLSLNGRAGRTERWGCPGNTEVQTPQSAAEGAVHRQRAGVPGTRAGVTPGHETAAGGGGNPQSRQRCQRCRSPGRKPLAAPWRPGDLGNR